jgi:hypothetical protein
VTRDFPDSDADSTFLLRVDDNRNERDGCVNLIWPHLLLRPSVSRGGHADTRRSCASGHVSQFGDVPKVVDTPTPAAGWSRPGSHQACGGLNESGGRKLASGEWRPAPATFPMVLRVVGAGHVEPTGEGRQQVCYR